MFACFLIMTEELKAQRKFEHQATNVVINKSALPPVQKKKKIQIAVC